MCCSPRQLILLVTALAYPIGWEIWTSFTDLSPLNDGPTAFVGLENYLRPRGRSRVLARGDGHRRLRGRDHAPSS